MSNIYFTGYRATGKTRHGKTIASRLNRPFIDTDVLIEEKCGKAIKDIVANEGWRGFRIHEMEIVKEVSNKDNQVIGLGGGAICHEFMDIREENRRIVRENGKVILLKAAPEVILSRLQGDTKTATQRPDLTNKGPFEEILAKLKERGPLYDSIADFIIDTSDSNEERIDEEIMEFLNKLNQ